MLVAKGYRAVDRDQRFLLPPDMREWLPGDHPVWLVIAAVEQMDTRAVHAHRQTGGVGRAGYDPDMLLTLLVWGWGQGVRSSRRIERACQQDVAFRVICAGDVPDHATISRFRAQTAEAMESIFAQVLMLCGRLGLGRLGVVALDGVKIGCDASLSANRTEEGLVRAAQVEQQRLAAKEAARAAAAGAAAEHAAADAAEDALFGVGERGDQERPAGPDRDADPGSVGSSRAERIASALADLQEPQAAARAAIGDADPAESADPAVDDLDVAAAPSSAADMGGDQQRSAGPDVRGPGGAAAAGSSRQERIAAALADLRAETQAQQQAADDKAQKWLATRDERAGRRAGRPPADIEVQVITARVEMLEAQRRAFQEDYWARRQAAQAAGTRDWGRVPVAETALLRRCRQQLANAIARERNRAAQRAQQPRRRNTTDPDSRPMPKRGGGWVQGFNCQAVTTSDGIIIAVSVSNNPSDVITYQQMTDLAVKAAALIGQRQPDPAGTRTSSDHDTAESATQIGLMLADAGYLSEENLTAPGPDRLIATGQHRQLERAARDNPTDQIDPADPDPAEKMSQRLRTPEGLASYRQRGHIAETPFGHAKHNWGFTRFTGRGLTRAKGEWHLHGAVHNLFKAITLGALTTPDLTATSG